MLTLDRATYPPPQSVVSVAQVGNVTLVSLSFAVIREQQALLLERPLSDLVDMASGKVAMDHSQVASFSCAWINTLIALTRRCRAQGGDLLLYGMAPFSSRTIRDTGLESHLHLVHDKVAALKAFGEEPLATWRLALARMLDIPVAIEETVPAATTRRAA
jgi:anti-anti-sigma regulatory factor